jgi:hypothetical protein
MFFRIPSREYESLTFPEVFKHELKEIDNMRTRRSIPVPKKTG